MPTNEGTRGDQRKSIEIANDLFTTHHRRLMAIATRNSPTHQDAEEALQDAFAIFIDHFNPNSEAPPLAWITLTLKRRCWTANRHQLPVQTNPENPQQAAKNTNDPTTDPSRSAFLNDEISQIRTSFQSLKPQERRALSLLALGHSYREICQQTGWTYTKVNRCITEGRAALRKTLR
jgi:RNA polymerase sigma factor (sigma-70 family)